MSIKKIDIYGTLGPSCEDENTLFEMFKNGMTGIRLNLSHKSLRESESVLEKYFSAASRAGINPKLLIDMQGPELRIGNLDNNIQLDDGDEVILGNKGIPVPNVVSDNISEEMEILLDDGKILLKTVNKHHGGFLCKVLRGGILKSRKSILVKGISIHSPTMTEQDIDNISIAKSFGVTGVMQPFVRDAEDLKIVRKCLNENCCEEVSLFAKIENRQGIDHLDELIPECDEIVVARGDLGNAVSLWELPKIQKEISSKCLIAERRFMIVTQMLASMESNPVPTRAEVSDIYNAVIDGASSVMVTGETAVGMYPGEVIKYLSRTAYSALT